MANELPKAYDPISTEHELYKTWEKSGYFNPDKLPGDRSDTFSISLPPPNATGILHIGHAVMLALQDLLVRFERMRGKKTLWLPGTDHAAIATQNVVEQELKAEGKKKDDIGRDGFLKRVDAYVASKRGTITEQIKRLGSSCDWSRERFTLDAGLSEAVRVAFMTLYNDGLIYRGDRIVNWCPRCQSTLADDEVEYKEKKTPFYYFKYGPVVIGTARPETKFGDKIIIVHPDDKRYKNIIGKSFEVDWILGPITAQVIADPAADPELGTGAMTITPGHSFEDFALAQKYRLSVEKIIDENGRLTEAAGGMKGLPVKEARKKVVEILQKKGLVDRIDENYMHNLSVCYRCGTPVEPLVSRQWFVAVDKPAERLGNKTLKQRALEVVEKNEISFIPNRFAKVYSHWITNLHDWCISRQIWYGHKIPIWYCETCHADTKKYSSGEYYWLPEKETPAACPRCQSQDIHQDHDTLDTWFSSSLWTFSTLGWPKKTKDLETFHPTSVMETGYDIIFFWVARMIIMSTYLVDQIPFKTVYLHGLVRDKKGRKMSKSLGNGIDPLEMADKYGADAVRLALVIGTTPGNDQKLDEQKIAGYRNYVNKVWNIGRFIALQNNDNSTTAPEIKTLADRWIMSRLHTIIIQQTSLIEKYEFSRAGESIYDFAWHEFADWYLEITKLEGNTALARHVFNEILKLLHPYMPFVTEAIWQNLGNKDLLMVAPWPNGDQSVINGEAELEFSKLQEIIIGFRRQRKEAGVPAGQPMTATLDKNSPLWQHQAIIEKLGKVTLQNNETQP